MVNQTMERWNSLFLQDYSSWKYCWDLRVLNNISFSLMFSVNWEVGRGIWQEDQNISFDSDKCIWTTWLKCVHMDLLIHSPNNTWCWLPRSSWPTWQGQSLSCQTLPLVEKITQGNTLSANRQVPGRRVRKCLRQACPVYSYKLN